MAGVPCTLTFDVDLLARSAAVGTASVNLDDVFAPNESEVSLNVRLFSDDFEMKPPMDTIVLRREGRSTKNAAFTITARRAGSSRMTAIIDRSNNFVRRMELNFEIGKDSKVEVASVGRPLAAVQFLESQIASLVITPEAAGYQCFLLGDHCRTASIRRMPYELAKAVQKAQAALAEVIGLENEAHDAVFQSGIDIPPQQQARALKIMSSAGKQLFDALFCYSGSDLNIRTFGDYLRNTVLSGDTLKFQVAADRVIIPWDLLYLADVDDENKLDWKQFLGMRHIVELIPENNGRSSCVPAALPSDKPHLLVSVNVNRTVDAAWPVKVVGPQLRYWEQAALKKQVRCVTRESESELVGALASGAADEQLMYFYCHASADPDEPDTATLTLTDDAHQIRLSNLIEKAPITKAPLKGAPLVFINACELAEMSPAFYDGFVPYFIEKGARGVIGTECKTPAIFAAEWAKRFFDLFLAGVPLGKAFLDLRREFLERHGNPLGLLYAVHSAGNAHVAPPI